MAREFPEPVDTLSNNLIDRILKRSAAFQGRIGSRKQVQIPLDFPQNPYWERLFSAWWEQGFRYWRARNAEDAVLNFPCELGPPPYAITTRDGCELSDRWQKGLVIKKRVEKIWQKLDLEI